MNSTPARCADVSPLDPLGTLRASGTRRIVLREFRCEDAFALWQLHRDPRVVEFVIDGVPNSQREALALILWLNKFMAARSGLGIWHASLREDGRFIGFFSLMPVAGSDSDIEIGARLARHGWGRGLALEGGQWLLYQAFTAAALDQVSALSHPANRSVQYVLGRLGFTCEGSEVQYGQAALRYSCARSSWQARQPANAHVFDCCAVDLLL
jgi:RimJ/RimL family protein N-acetyltransferase